MLSDQIQARTYQCFRCNAPCDTANYVRLAHADFNVTASFAQPGSKSNMLTQVKDCLALFLASLLCIGDGEFFDVFSGILIRCRQVPFGVYVPILSQVVRVGDDPPGELIVVSQ